MDLTSMLLAKVGLAMDKAMNAYHEDEDIIFNDLSRSKRFHYDPKYMLSLGWKNSNICMYPGCDQSAVKASHTIQKSASLRSIAQDNHLLTPKFDYRREVMDLIPIGLNEASTFPGFCPGHEQLFGVYEDRKDLKEEEDFRLQLYRTICREIIANERSLKSFVLRKSQYVTFRDETLNDMIRKEAIALGVLPEQMKQFTHEYRDHRIRSLNAAIEEIKTNLLHLDVFYQEIFNDIRKAKIQKIFFQVVGMDWVIPCALAGRGEFIAQTRSKKVNVEVIINVIPYHDRTYVIIGTHHKMKEHLKSYLRRYTEHPMKMIAMIESWMLYGSDHWFLQPAVWWELAEVDKGLLIEEMFTKKNINELPPLPIFIGLRSQLNKMMNPSDQA